MAKTVDFSEKDLQLYAVVLAGGSGTRLWPISRQTVPKQFLRLYGHKTLIGHTIGRVLPLVSPENVLIVSGKSQLPELLASGLGKYRRLEEPLPRNTAPAAALAALQICAEDGDGLMAILPSDHMIKDEAAFRRAIKTACRAAASGKIVTLGIKPSHPETGYGYIETPGRAARIRGAVEALRFVEKPSLELARRYVRSGRFLWNAGIFVLKASVLLEEFRAHVPAARGVLVRLRAGAFRGGSLRRGELARIFPDFPSISLDYGIMEKSARVVTVPCEMGWSDLGNWRCLHELSPKDGQGNSRRGDTVLYGCKNTFVHASSGLVAVLGMENTAVVESRDAVLVCPLDRAQELSRITDRLKSEKRSQLRWHLSETRPWGSVSLLESGHGHAVRRITVAPGAELSGAECAALRGHFVVAAGNAQVRQGGRILRLDAHCAFDASRAAVSAIKNAGREPLDIIGIMPARRGP